MHLITRRTAPTQAGPKIDDTRDRLLCRAMLEELRAAVEQAKARGKQTEHAASRVTLETVTLLCGSAAEALEKHLGLATKKPSPQPHHCNPDAAKEPLSSDELEWRPGEFLSLG